MNSRIKELMIKSGAYEHYEINEGVNGDELPMVKFAELIIQECIKCCDDVNKIFTDQASAATTKEDFDLGFNKGSAVCSVKFVVKQHFGIDEVQWFDEDPPC